MKNNSIQEIIISIVLIILLILLLNPFYLWMPNMMLMTIVIGLVLVFSIFVVFIWREKVQDEREELHKLKSSRIAFLAGASILMIGIVVESLSHNINIWLITALSIMIISKVIGLAYNRFSS